MENPEGPATDRQKKFASDLGIRFRADVTKQDLSNKISTALKNRPPTEPQLELAKSLDLPISATISGSELRKLIDTELQRRGRQAMQNSTVKVGKVIVRNGVAFRITSFSVRRKQHMVHLQPFFRGVGRSIVVNASTLLDAEEATQRQLERMLMKIR